MKSSAIQNNGATGGVPAAGLLLEGTEEDGKEQETGPLVPFWMRAGHAREPRVDL